ncbi:ankyrin repeat domain-containing protein [Pseudoduganella lutea]|uniref:Uncharacterized protein n=1 Tax=Pseudoduganella lutea TaxID=321985 RepID=A0A4P6KSQ1_9BURK|nr:ankyrin repeat domain-containing protein [Pseudoduganella lutea]QBE61900.1 hypothetical protein EWM63_01895 [Pseudoduganella lutea]
MNLANAIRQDDMTQVREHLGTMKNPAQRDADGFTPLMLASALGKTGIVHLLLDAGADVHAVDARMGTTALHKAAQAGSVDAVRVLLDNGAFIDQQSAGLGNTALMDATVHRHERVVRFLLDRGARTTPMNYAGETALDLARAGRLEAIAGLIETRIACDQARIRGQSLMAAVKRDDLADVRRLVAAGHAVDERSPRSGGPDEDCTPLGMAARMGHAGIVRALLELGADAARVNGPMKATAAHEAAYFGHADVLRVLASPLHEGAAVVDIDARGQYNGMTALHDAVWHGHLDAARALVRAGARLDLRSHAGLRPRELAELHGYDEVARMIAIAEAGSQQDRAIPAAMRSA